MPQHVRARRSCAATLAAAAAAYECMIAQRRACGVHACAQAKHHWWKGYVVCQVPTTSDLTFAERLKTD
eukprot:1142514-Pelagomonas_calceolata.AAC.2